MNQKTVNEKEPNTVNKRNQNTIKKENQNMIHEKETNTVNEKIQKTAKEAGEHPASKSRNYILSIVYIAFFVCILALCSFIKIPLVVPFTLQTFGIFLALEVLGGKRGTICILVYLLLGAIGVPVFSGMTGGVGVLLNTTGGYLIGFLFQGLIYWLLTSLLGNKFWVRIVSLVLGLAACYLFGTIWFYILYTQKTGAIGFVEVLGFCVFPFILPDLGKMALAVGIRRLLSPVLPEFLKKNPKKDK